MVVGPGCMDMGRNTENVAVNVHGYINICLELDLQANGHHPVLTVWKSSSSSSMWTSWRELFMVVGH